MQTSRLEAVKELLFGQNMKEYEKEFHEINTLIAQNKEKFDQKMVDINHSFVESLNDLNSKFYKRMDELEHKVMEELEMQKNQQIDKVQLSKIFKGIGVLLNKE